MRLEIANSPLLPMPPNNHPQGGFKSPSHDMDLEPLIREELARIVNSRVFRSSMRMKRFLRLVVEETLEGRADCLKEYVIGTDVYDRTPPYEPSQDSIVRTEARRLRGKLKEYYETEGKRDPLIIGFPTGGYVPVFEPREQSTSFRLQTDRPVESVSPELMEVLVVVMRFDDVSGDQFAEDCARAISERITLKLRQRPIHKPVLDHPLE